MASPTVVAPSYQTNIADGASQQPVTANWDIDGDGKPDIAMRVTGQVSGAGQWTAAYDALGALPHMTGGHWIRPNTPAIAANRNLGTLQGYQVSGFDP